MPSTVTQTRPDEATGFRHISDAANAIVARANATQHPNAVRMHDAVDSWIADAKGRGPVMGRTYLEACRAKIASNLQNLADWACNRADLRKGLEGLTVDDIEAAGHRIDKALREIGEQS